MFAIRLVVSLIVCTISLAASGMTDLLSRGYALVPEPQRIALTGGDFVFGRQWRSVPSSRVESNQSALQSLNEGLMDRFHLSMNEGGSGGEVRLTLLPGSVQPGASQDRDTSAIAEQAYRLRLSPSRIEITANSDTGLFYGVQTLMQLLKRRDGKLYLPEGEVTDWPDLRLRVIYWDDAHHLERLSVLKNAVRQAAFYKINGLALKLEGHFLYQHAPAIVEPQALSASQFQQLTDYGLRHHVQVIPYLDAPAHIAFILKHPEYTSLRQFPDSNYESCATNPDTLQLLYGMYDDLLAANRGVHYFYLSTDEAYYAGMSNLRSCNEAQRQHDLGSAGKVLAEFLQKAAGHLKQAGREVIFWGELPLKPSDIPSLPSFLINGETYGVKFDPLYKLHGIRQMMYQSTEGEERLFPQYSLLPAGRRILPLHEDAVRVRDGIASVAAEPARKTSDLMGLTVAGWADMGLHPETFWLGYATITAAGWRCWSIDAKVASSAFYSLFYGPNVIRMDRVYELMSYQAQVWTDTWDMVDSKQRIPIWGNSEKIFQPRKPASDQSIPLPPAPDDRLAYRADWSDSNRVRLHCAEQALTENDELEALLSKNVELVSTNGYNLEVFRSIALLCRQNLTLLLGIKEIDRSLARASLAAGKNESRQALAFLDEALAESRRIRERRNQTLENAISTWYKSWLPRVPEANGRRFLYQVDDVKDHLPDRTIDMSYLIYRDLSLPFDDWYRATLQARNRYAESRKLPLNTTRLDWRQHP